MNHHICPAVLDNLRELQGAYWQYAMCEAKQVEQLID